MAAPLAFVLATFGLWSVVEFVLSHLLGFAMLGGTATLVAAGLIAILVPGGLALIRTALGIVAGALRALIGTEAGRAAILAIAVFWVGWGARAWLDESVAVRHALAAQVAATEAAQAAAAQARLQADVAARIGDDAARRAEAAEAERQDLEEQAADLVDQLDAADKAAARPARRYPLTAADIAALARIGTAAPR